MPQYDACEDVEPTMTQQKQVLEDAPRRPSRIEIPINRALVTCYDEGINKPSDTDTPEINQDLPSPRHFHRRHSLLSSPVSPTENPLESATFPDSRVSPRDLSTADKLHPREFEHLQQQADDIKMGFESDRQESKAATDRKEETRRDVEDSGAESISYKGGWMHRSRANCELLRDHVYKMFEGYNRD
jgi:hypothetical protein